MALDPNIVLQAGKTQPLDLGALLQQRNAIRLGSLAANRQQQTQDALDRVRSDPSDMHAIADLAALDPTAANGYLAAQAAGRAGQARQATANLFRSGSPDAIPASDPAAPAPAPGAPTGTTVALPATGQSVTLPNPDGGAPAPAAVPAPPGGGASPPAPGGATDPFDHKGPAEQIVGANVTNGKMTMQEAAAQLAEVADPEQVKQVLGSLQAMDDLQFKRVAQTNKTMADTLAAIKQSVPMDPNDPTQAARHAALMQNAPQLASLGVTPQQLAQLDLSDQGINGVVGKAMGYQGIIDQANKDRDAAREQQQVDETHRHNIVDEHKPVSQSFGTNLIDPITGKVVADGSGGAAAGSGVQFTGGWTPRARNGGDNSDASVDSKISGAAQMLGVKPGDDLTKVDPMKIAQAMTFGEGGNGTLADRNNNPANLRNADGSYKKFPSRAAGLQAAANLVSQKIRNGQTTVQTLIEGVPANGGASTIRPAGGLSADALTNAADYMIANGGKAPTGFSRNQAAQAALQNAFTTRMQQKGLTMDDVIKGGQSTASQGNAFKQWNSGRPGTGAVVARSMSVAVEHLDQAQQLANALQNGNTPLFNKIAQGWAEQTGKPAPTNFAAVKDFVTDEVVKGVLGGPGAAGDREKANSILANWNSPAQTAGIVKQLQGLMASQLRGQSMQYHVTTGRDDFTKYVSPRANQVLSAHGLQGAVPAAAAAYLKQNPATRAQFDQKYGAGASAAILGG